MNFEPLKLLRKRVALSKLEADSIYFDELLLYAEFLTKIISIQLVSSIIQEKDKVKYKYHYTLVRSNAVGDFAKVIDEVLTNHGDKLIPDFAINEGKQLSKKTKNGDWQYEALSAINELSSNLKISLQVLPTKASLRRWFTDFTILRNKSKGHGALKPSLRAKNVSLLENSIHLIEKNYYSFSNRSWVYLYQNLSGKYRVSPITNKTNPFDHLKKSGEFRKKFPDGSYCFIEKPIPIDLLITTPELDDFFVPNGNCNNGSYEILSYISGTREKVKNELYTLPATQLPKSHTEGIGKLDIQGESFGNVPPKPPVYINRSIIENELNEQLLNTYMSPIITLLGKGGIGKTTTALNCLHELTQTEQFTLIIWFSSRDIDLLVDGPKAVKAKIFTIQDIADEYCRLLDKKCPSKKERLNIFQNALSTESELGKSLFVFDNFETIYDPLEVYHYLYQYIRPPNKILITSRESRDFKGDYPIEIGKMTYTECKKLISIYSEKLNVTSLLSSDYIDKLIEESNGHPYIIKILLGEAARSKKTKKIERIVAGREDILTALFRRTFTSLSHAAVRVFLTLCSWRSAIPQIALEAVLLRPQNEERIDVNEAIEELRKCSLIDVYKSEIDQSTFIGVPLAASIFGKEELDIYPEKLAVLEDRNLLLQFGVTQENDVKKGLLPKIEKKFRAISKVIDSNPKKGKLYLSENLPILEYLCRKVPRAYIFLGNLFEELDDTDNLIISTQRYIQSNPSPSQKRSSWKKLANKFGENNNWISESHALSEICLIPNTQISEISSIADRIIKKVDNQNQTDVEHKTRVFSKVAEIFEQRIGESDSSTDYSRLAWLYIHLRKHDKSLKYAKKGITINPSCPYCKKIIKRLEKG